MWYAIRLMDVASNLFIAAFLILVAASAAVVGSMILLGLIDRIFRKKPPEPVAAVPEEEEVLEEWTEDLLVQGRGPRRPGLRGRFSSRP